MDTALAAMKRAARAVLKDELKKLRAQNRKLRIESAVQASKLASSAQALAYSRHDHGETQQRLAELRSNVDKLKDWAEVNAKGNTVVKHVLDAVVFKATYGSVHPFARWDLPLLK